MVCAMRAQIAEITPATAIVVDQITHHSLSVRQTRLHVTLTQDEKKNGKEEKKKVRLVINNNPSVKKVTQNLYVPILLFPIRPSTSGGPA